MGSGRHSLDVDFVTLGGQLVINRHYAHNVVLSEIACYRQ
jgi:hypothetical protein